MYKWLKCVVAFLITIGITIPEAALAKAKANIQKKKPAAKKVKAQKPVKPRKQKVKKAAAPKKVKVKKQRKPKLTKQAKAQAKKQAKLAKPAPKPKKLSKKEQVRQQQAEQARQRQAQAAAAERQRQQAEAERLRQQREEAERQRQEEARQRQQREEAAERQRQQAEAERLRQQREEAERQRQEEERRLEEAENLRMVAEFERREQAAAERQRQAEAAERQRQQAEAAERLRQQREAEERQRQQAEAERLRLAEAERQRLQAEAAERQRQAEAAERQRLQAEVEERQRLAEEERRLEEAENLRMVAEFERLEQAEAERQRQQQEAAERQRQEEDRQRLLAEAAERLRQQREAEERQRQQAEAAAERQRQEEERQRLLAEAAARQPQPVNPGARNPQVQANAPLPEVRNLNDLNQHYLIPLRQKVEANIALNGYYDESLTQLSRGAGEIKLREALAKQLKLKVEFWENKIRAGFAEADEDALIKDVYSCNNAIDKVLKNTGIPAADQIPAKLKVNPWMINSPFLEKLYAAQNAAVNIDNIDEEPSQFILTQALIKIGNLFDRLVREDKIKRVNLLDYESVPNDLKEEYGNANRNRYPTFIEYFEHRRQQTELEVRWFGAAQARDRLEPFKHFAQKAHLIGGPTGELNLDGQPEVKLGIFNQTPRAKNRAIALANNLIWRRGDNGVDVQKLSDEEAAELLARLARGGCHCAVRAEEDTDWAVKKCSQGAVAESKEKLELRVAYFVDRLKQRAIEEMVGDEEIAAENQNNANRPRATQIAHLTQLIQRRLRPYIGSSPEDLNVQDDTNFFREYANRPIHQVLGSFNAKFTPEKLIEELVREVTDGIGRAQHNAIIKMEHLNEYADRFGQGEDPETVGLLNENYEFKRENAVRLLCGFGYLEEDN